VKIKGHTLGAWFNHKRFSQRKAKGYRLSRRFDHLLSRWFNHLLFKLLPPRWYLRTQGIKVRRKQNVIVTITYLRQGYSLINRKWALVKFANAEAVVKMIPLWFEHGFCEPIPGLSPYIPRHLDNERYYIPPGNILRVKWYDPVLEDHISIENPSWRSDGHDGDSPIG